MQKNTELTHTLKKYIYQEAKQNKRFLFIKACPKLAGYYSLDIINIINPPIIQNKQLAFNNCHINYLYTLKPTNLYSISFVNHPPLTYIKIKFNISSTIQYITTDNLTAKYLLKNTFKTLQRNLIKWYSIQNKTITIKNKFNIELQNIMRIYKNLINKLNNNHDNEKQ